MSLNRRRRLFDLAINLESLEGRQLFAQAPFTGSPFPVGNTPITIQAEEYDLGGQGVAYNDTTTTNLGGQYRPEEGVDIKTVAGTSGDYRISDALEGEWIEYTIDVATAGEYRMEFRVGQRDPGSTFHVEIDGTNVTGAMTVPDTNSFDAFQTIAKSVTLQSGVQVVRFVFDNPGATGYGAAFDWMKLSKLADPGDSEPAPRPAGNVIIDSPTSAYVRDGTSANTNFGSAAELIVKRSATAGNTRETYLKFDLASLPVDGSVTNATLRLFGGTGNAPGSVGVGAYVVSNTSWAENSITWNNKPASGSTALETRTISGTAGTWYEWDLTSLVQQARDAGQQFISIALKASDITDPWAVFSSDDAEMNAPQLSVTTSTSTPIQDLVVSTDRVSIDEGSQSSFTVKLATQPASDVTVIISRNSGGDEDLYAGATTLTFTPANWDQPQTVNVSAAEDADFSNGSATFTIASDGLASKTIAATEVENDTPPASQGTVVIGTNHAAYVRDGTSAGTNFGNDVVMQVKRSGSTGNNREGYLKFDVSSLAAGTITNAKLRVFGQLTTTNGTVTIGSYSVSNTTWDESNLTWNNKPSSSSTATATQTLTSTTGGWIEWDVTTVVQQARAAGAQYVSIALKATGTSDPYAVLNTDDAAANTPQLSVTTSTPTQDIVVSSGNVSVNEGSQSSFTVRLATQPTNDVAVSISRNSGGDEDLNAGATTLTFTSANWDQPQTVNVSAAEDADFSNGSATFTIASDGLASKTVIATEVENDTPPPPQSLVVTPATMTVPEAGQNAFTVKLGTAPTSDVIVTIAKNGGGDADLNANATTLTFTAANWDTAQTVNVAATADADTTNGSATFTISTAGVTSKTVTATEADDDTPPQPSTISTTIGAYVRGGTYASQNFGTVNDLIVKKWSSSTDTRETYVRFNLAGVTSIASAKLRLFGRVSGSSGSVAVNVYDSTNTTWGETAITWNNKPASGTAVRGSVTFTGTTARWYEADVTTFLQSELAAGRTLVTLVLKGAVNNSAPVLIQSDETINRPQLSITPGSTQPPPQGLVVSTNSVSVNEGAQTPFTVKLAAQPTSDVTVTISKAGDADLSSDVTTLTFTSANWNTAQTINVVAAEDADTANGQATFTVSSTGLSSKTVSATEADDDVQGLVVSNAALAVPEAGNNLFTVKLAAQPTSNVTVTVSKSSGGDPDLDIEPTTLTFTPANWGTPQSVTITATADPDTTNGSATFTVASNGLTSKSVVSTEVDDDTTRQPATYYVNLNGNDSNAGTSPVAAWKSTAKVNAMTFIPGDSILFQGQQSFAGGISFNANDSGTDASGNLIAPITLGSYGTGSATIGSGSGFGFYAQNAGGIVLQDLDFRGAGLDANTSDGIAFFNNAPGNVKQSTITVRRVTVSGFGKNGLGLGGFNGASGYRNVQVTDSQFFGNRDGITVYGPAFDASNPVYVNQDVRVANVYAYDNLGSASAANPTGNGIALGSVSNGVIERSVAHDNGVRNTSKTGPVGIWAYNSDRVTIQYNESYSNRRGTGGDGDGFDLDQNTSNSVMQYNYAHDNDGAGYLIYMGQTNNRHRNNVVRYNVSERDGRTNGYGGIVIGGLVNNLDVYNNTIYFPSGSFGTASAAVYITSIGDHVRLRNNIFVTTGGARLVSTPDVVNELLFQRNVYWSSGASTAIRWGANTYTSVSGWLDARTEQERIDLDNDGSLDRAALGVDPRLTSPGNGGTIGDANDLHDLTAYRLLSDSPLRDVGLDLEARYGIDPGDLDFYGTSIKQGSGFDVGADEF